MANLSARRRVYYQFIKGADEVMADCRCVGRGTITPESYPGDA